MREPKSFVIARFDTLRVAKFCWLCENPMKPGIRVAICEYGNDTNDWTLAHDTCAIESSLNAESEGMSVTGGKQIVWRQLEDGYTGRNRYVVLIDGTEVIRTSAKDKAIGMVELLEGYPEAVAAILAEVRQTG